MLRKIATGIALLLTTCTILFLIFAPGYVERSRNPVSPHDPYPVSAAARTLHSALFVGDWHADSLLWNRPLDKKGARGQVDIPRLIEGGVGLQVFTAVTKSPAGQNYDSNSSQTRDNITLLAAGQLWPVKTWGSLTERALYQAKKLARVEHAVPHQFKIIRTRQDLDDLVAARRDGQIIVGGMLGIEGAHALEGDLANLDRLVDAGHRVIGLHHFFDNALGGSLHGLNNAGLTEFGETVVDAIHKKGLVLDLAHSSEQVARDVIDRTDFPLIVSHSGIYGHCPAKRNYPDDLIKAVAKTGGVIGIGYWAEVACGDITPSGIAKMILKGIEVVGEDHISLGSDFDGSVRTAFDTSEMPALTHALMQVGLSDAQIAKVMGANMLRVLRERLN